MRGGMGTQSAGAYLRELREARGWSLATVGARLQTSKSQIDRIERGRGETRTTLLLSYARLLGANIRKVIALMPDEPFVDDAEWAEFDKLSPEQQQIVIGILKEFARDA